MIRTELHITNSFYFSGDLDWSGRGWSFTRQFSWAQNKDPSISWIRWKHVVHLEYFDYRQGFPAVLKNTEFFDKSSINIDI